MVAQPFVFRQDITEVGETVSMGQARDLESLEMSCSTSVELG